MSAKTQWGRISQAKTILLIVIALMTSLILTSFVTLPAKADSPSLLVETPTIELGKPVLVSGSGFLPDEQVALWLTAPNGQAYTYDRAYASDGTFSWSRPDRAQGAITQPGSWHITAYGLQSNLTLTNNFTVMNPTFSASIMDLGGETMAVEVTGDHFMPGEKITIWVTNPSLGLVEYLGYAWVYRGGNIIEGKNFSFEGAKGLHRVTAYGNTSGLYLVSDIMVN